MVTCYNIPAIRSLVLYHLEREDKVGGCVDMKIAEWERKSRVWEARLG